MLVATNSLNLTNPTGFLVLDGVNGAGKSTMLKKILAYLDSKEQKAIGTFEPGATGLGKAIRSIVMEKRLEQISPLAEAFLFAADRNQHIEQLVSPELQRGNIVVSDRYYYSTLAFQGFGRGLPLPALKEINRIAINDLKPDLVFLFDLAPELGLARTKRRDSKEKDAFEEEELSFHTRLRDGFLEISKELPEPFVLIDASLPEDSVWEQILPALNNWLEQLLDYRK